MDTAKSIEFESKLRDLLAALNALADEISDDSSFRGAEESIRSLSVSLHSATAGRFDSGRVVKTTTEIKQALCGLSKADLRSQNLERVQDLIYIFQESRYQDEMKRRYDC